MLSPRNCQLMLLQSPSAISTLRATPSQDCRSSMKFNPGPQFGISGGTTAPRNGDRIADAGDRRHERNAGPRPCAHRACAAGEPADEEHQPEPGEGDALEDAEQARLYPQIGTARRTHTRAARRSTGTRQKLLAETQRNGFTALGRGGGIIAPAAQNENPGTWRGLSWIRVGPDQSASTAEAASGRSTSSTYAIGALSPARKPREDAQVAARAGGVAQAELDEQLADGLLVAQARENARRRLATPSTLPRVISGSATRRSSLALGRWCG